MTEPIKSLSNQESDNALTSQEILPITPEKNCEECKGKVQFAESVKNARVDARNQNKILSDEIAKLEDLLSQARNNKREKKEYIARLKQDLKDSEESKRSYLE